MDYNKLSSFISSIPPFDGSQSDLYPFIRAIDAIKSDLNHSEFKVQLTQQILLRITGREVILTYNPSSWDDVKRTLITHFDTAETELQLQERLCSATFTTASRLYDYFSSIMSAAKVQYSSREKLREPAYLLTLDGKIECTELIRTFAPEEFGVKAIMNWKIANISFQNFDAIIGMDILVALGTSIGICRSELKINGNVIPFETDIPTQIIQEFSNAIDNIETQIDQQPDPNTHSIEEMPILLSSVYENMGGGETARNDSNLSVHASTLRCCNQSNTSWYFSDNEEIAPWAPKRTNGR
ncbi:unnamed protein product [Hermetia illucens]|uniref:Uncharacterized protein n=1 Tax=Hermetia illucens TaxID=343691 RepID=A0A7R8UVX2_HERIL|nr:unnamed protein product [Hermetia illucens]